MRAAGAMIIFLPILRESPNLGLLLESLSAGGVEHRSVLLDTGSELTWLPAASCRWVTPGRTTAPKFSGLQLGRKPGACRRTGRTFFLRYKDNSTVTGQRCVANLSLAGLEWEQELGAASLVETAGTAPVGGVLGLSPAPASSIRPLLAAAARQHALPRLLSVCTRGRALVVGAPCASARRSRRLSSASGGGAGGSCAADAAGDEAAREARRGCVAPAEASETADETPWDDAVPPLYARWQPVLRPASGGPARHWHVAAASTPRLTFPGGAAARLVGAHRDVLRRVRRG